MLVFSHCDAALNRCFLRSKGANCLSGQVGRKPAYNNHIFEAGTSGALICQRVFDPAAKNDGSGITAAQGGFFCYFSCPPRKVEKKIRNY